MEEVRLQRNWAPSSGFLNNSFSLACRLARNALLLLGLNYKAGLADMPECPCYSSGIEETAEHAFYYCERVRPFWNHAGKWTAHAVRHWLCRSQRFAAVSMWEAYDVSRDPKCNWNGDLDDGSNFSHRDQIWFFWHQLRVKIRCDRKCLDRITFDKRWVHAVSLVLRKGTMLKSSFPTHGYYGSGRSGPPTTTTSYFDCLSP